MTSMKSDLYRNFAIGFFVGTLIVILQVNPDLAGQLVPDAVAATLR